MRSQAFLPGTVYICGVGPGDPELLTIKARRLIESADLILYAGSLIMPEILAFARPGVICRDTASLPMSEQISLFKDAAEKKMVIARLHTGDPSLFGAIDEQMRALRDAGIPYHIIPGVSSVFAAAATLGIEYTLAENTQTLICTRHTGKTPVPERERMRSLAAHHTSMAIFLSTGMIAGVTDELMIAGYPPDTPVALVYRASWPDERVLQGTIASIASLAESAELTHQALIIISPALRDIPHLPSHLYGDFQRDPDKRGGTAILALTAKAAETGRSLHAQLSQSTLYLPTRLGKATDREDTQIFLCSESIRQTLQTAFKRHAALVCIMACGIVVRELAPLLKNKHTDPAVVVLDPDGQSVISLLGGHGAGANDLARQVAALTGGKAIITTASDAQGLPAIDTIAQKNRWKIADGSNLTGVMAAIVNGKKIAVVQDGGHYWNPDHTPADWIFCDSPAGAAKEAAEALIYLSAYIPAAESLKNFPHVVLFHPPCLVAGVGCNRGTPAEEILQILDETLTEHHLAASSIFALATIDEKSSEPGIRQVCQQKGWQLRSISKEEIQNIQEIPTPSEAAFAAMGVWGVAEPAAMIAAGTRQLLVKKQKSANVTIAIAMKGQVGSIKIIGIGPGDPAWIAPAALYALQSADIILGYNTYLEQIESICPHIPREGSSMRQETARARRALALAGSGKNVALISGGDAGIYGMAGLVLEAHANLPTGDIPIEVIPGISALNAAAALLGAPLMNDFCAISLSDLQVPLEEILRRLALAAEAGFVLCLYNPRSRTRTRPFDLACELLLQKLPPETPVGIVQAAFRPGQKVQILPLNTLPTLAIGMDTILIIGNRSTTICQGKMVTPRRYPTNQSLEEKTEEDR